MLGLLMQYSPQIGSCIAPRMHLGSVHQGCHASFVVVFLSPLIDDAPGCLRRQRTALQLTTHCSPFSRAKILRYQTMNNALRGYGYARPTPPVLDAPFTRLVCLLQAPDRLPYEA